MKLSVDVDGVEYLVELRKTDAGLDFELADESGTASIAQVGEGVYSVLLGCRSVTVRVARDTDYLVVHVNGTRHRIRVRDARDRRSQKTAAMDGPVEIRAQMPGKIVKVLAKAGEDVEAGQGLIIVEAMKMQNEIAAPKSGTVKRVAVTEGATVGAGEVLLVVI